MLVEARVDYKAGGYPLPTYKGEHAVSFNIEDYADEIQVHRAIRDRARGDICVKMCFGISSITVSNIRDVKITKL